MKKVITLIVLILSLTACEGEGPNSWTVPLTVVLPPDIIMQLETVEEVADPMIVMYTIDPEFGSSTHLQLITKTAAQNMGAEILESTINISTGIATLKYLTMDDIEVGILLFRGTSCYPETTILAAIKYMSPETDGESDETCDDIMGSCQK